MGHFMAGTNEHGTYYKTRTLHTGTSGPEEKLVKLVYNAYITVESLTYGLYGVYTCNAKRTCAK